MNQGDQLCFNSVAVDVISMKDECSKRICFSEVCTGSLPLLPQPLVLGCGELWGHSCLHNFLQIWYKNWLKGARTLHAEEEFNVPLPKATRWRMTTTNLSVCLMCVTGVVMWSLSVWDLCDRCGCLTMWQMCDWLTDALWPLWQVWHQIYLPDELFHRRCWEGWCVAVCRDKPAFWGTSVQCQGAQMVRCQPLPVSSWSWHCASIILYCQLHFWCCCSVPRVLHGIWCRCRVWIPGCVVVFCACVG